MNEPNTFPTLSRYPFFSYFINIYYPELLNYVTVEGINESGESLRFHVAELSEKYVLNSLTSGIFLKSLQSEIGNVHKLSRDSF